MPLHAQLAWPQPRGRKKRGFKWVDVDFPVGSAGRYSPDRVTWHGRHFDRLRPVSLSSHGVLPWDQPDWPPTRLVFSTSDYSRELVPIWERDPRTEPSSHFAGNSTVFPRQLAAGLFARLPAAEPGERNEVWNREHRVFQLVDQASWEWATERQDPHLRPLDGAEEVLASSSRSAAWLMRYASGYDVSGQLWRGLVERQPEFLARIWDLVFGAQPHHRKRSLVVVASSGHTVEAVDLRPDRATPYDLRFSRLRGLRWNEVKKKEEPDDD